LPFWVRERHHELEDELLLPGHEQWIAIKIAGATYDYEVTVIPMRDGAPIGAAFAPIPCECNSEALLELIDVEVADAAEELRSTPLAPLHPIEPDPRLEASDSLGEPSHEASMSTLSVGGVGVATFGVVSLGGGIAALLVGEQKINGHSKFRRNFSPLGVGALSVGGAAVLGGMTMVIVDLVRCRRASAHSCRRERGKERVSPSPMANPGHLGVLLTKRF